jgi:hypothetical protein
MRVITRRPSYGKQERVERVPVQRVLRRERERVRLVWLRAVGAKVVRVRGGERIRKAAEVRMQVRYVPVYCTNQMKTKNTVRSLKL